MPNITSVRAVRRPPFECAARSSGPRYASTSTRRPHRRLPSSSRTRTLSRRSRATSRVSRSKNDASRTLPLGDVVRVRLWLRAGLRLPRRQPLPSRMAPPFVDVESLVRGLVHRLPVKSLPPRGDADAELHRHRQLRGAIQVLEGLAHSDSDLARVALVGVRHGDPELVAAQSA